MCRRKVYDDLAPDEFDADGYSVPSQGVAVAWRVLGWETNPVAVILCPDCDYHAIERPTGGGAVLDEGDDDCDHADAYQCDEGETERTGELVCVMVGDDRHFTFDPSELVELADDAYCNGCGQIGCGWC